MMSCIYSDINEPYAYGRTIFTAPSGHTTSNATVVSYTRIK